MSQLYIMIIRYYNFFGQQTRVTATLTYTGKKKKKDVLRNCAKLTKKTPVPESLFNFVKPVFH